MLESSINSLLTSTVLRLKKKKKNHVLGIFIPKSLPII